MLEKAPKKICSLICDDIRHEIGNKVSLIGVYAETLMFDGFTSPESLGVPQLGVYAQFENPGAPFKSHVEILSPSKQVLFKSDDHEGPPEGDENGIITFSLKILRFPFPEVGEYSIVFWFDKKKSVHTFSVLLAGQK